MPDDHQLFAGALDFDPAAGASHADGLDGRQFARAGRLRDVACGRQVAAIEAAEYPLALLRQAGVGEEYRLLDDCRLGVLFPERRFDGAEGVAELLAERVAAAGDRGRQDVTDAAEIDDRIAAAVLGHRADRVVGHAGPLLVSWASAATRPLPCVPLCSAAENFDEPKGV